MRVLIQRVKSAAVRTVGNNGKSTSNSIDRGMLLLVGIRKGDSEEAVKEMAEKIYNLRIFENNGKIDLSIEDIDGEILAVPQFTLYGKTDKGRRPDFTDAEKPGRAKELFDKFCEYLGELTTCKKGFFGKKMEVNIINYGPVTLMVEK